MIGRRFGKLVVKSLFHKDKHRNRKWRCKCDCGKFTNVYQHHLKLGHTLSCGCHKKSLIKHTIRYNGVTDTIYGWSKTVDVPVATIFRRFKKGWKPKECLYGKD